jgi:hypothetical protein
VAFNYNPRATKKEGPARRTVLTLQKKQPGITLQRGEELVTYSVANKRRIFRGLIDVNRLNLLHLPSPQSIRTGVQGVEWGATRDLF